MIDFNGYKYAITRNYKDGELYLFNDLEVTEHGFKTGPFVYSKKINTLHTNPDYKESKEMIYTQEMADKGIPPKIGMKFICNDETPDSRISDFFGKEVEVIGLCAHGVETVITFKHLMQGIGCGIFTTRWIKLIDTRTDEEKAIDDLDLCITAANNDLINEYKQTKYFSTESSVLLEKIKDGKIHGVSFTESK